MSRQYPWITAVTGIILVLTAAFFSYYLVDDAVIWIVITGAVEGALILLGELIGCRIANRSGKLYAPNIGVLISCAVLLIPSAILFLLIITHEPSPYFDLAPTIYLLIILLIAPLPVAALTVDLISFRRKKNRAKRAASTDSDRSAEEKKKRLRLKPFIPYLIVLSSGCAVFLIKSIVIFPIFYQNTAYFVFMELGRQLVIFAAAMLIGVLVRQLSGFRFLGYILISVTPIHDIIAQFRNISYFSSNTELNESFIQAQITEAWIYICIFSALLIGYITAFAAAVFKYVKSRKAS